MNKYAYLNILLLTIVLCDSCRSQVKTESQGDNIKHENKSPGPHTIVRNLIQDRKGIIWIAAFDGIFRYDGKSFTNIMGKVISARFFSILEDSKGNLWFGSMGAGVFEYNGKILNNFTTKDGLIDNNITNLYEDKAGDIWFGSERGASRYNGRNFRNYTMKDGLPSNDINSIVEDHNGKFWFGTRGDACVYDGKAFATLIHDRKSFTNVRSIIEDKKGNIWLGGQDGLWRYGSHRFTNVSQKSVGYVYKDKKGNIWTSSENTKSQVWASENYDAKLLPGSGHRNDWVLTRYDERSLLDERLTIREVNPQAGMICGILEADDGSIWFGASDGVYRYDGNKIAGFNCK